MSKGYSASKLILIQSNLVQVDFVKVEPFADEDDYRTAEFVRSALIEASNSRDLRQIFRFGTAKQPLVPLVMLKIRQYKTNTGELLRSTTLSLSIPSAGTRVRASLKTRLNVVVIVKMRGVRVLVQGSQTFLYLPNPQSFDPF